MSLLAIEAYARQRGMAVEHRLLYESEMQSRLRTRLGLTDRRWNVIARMIRAITFGRVDAWRSDAILILRR
jgi:hypothetical protein